MRSERSRYRYRHFPQGPIDLSVEQHVADAFDIAHRACFVERGRIAMTGTCAALIQNSEVQRAYTGL